MINRIESYKGKVLPICGRPGMGQEAICLQIALKYHKLTNRSIFIFTPNQPKREIQMRLVSIRDGYGYYWAKGGHMKQSVLENYYAYVRGMDFSQPYVDDTENITEEYLINCIGSSENLGMIVMLDYDFFADKVSVPFLRMIATQMQIPILVSCLVKREVDDRDDCHPLREDMKSEELANSDTVMLVYRNNYYNLDLPYDEAELIIDKNGALETTLFHYNCNRLMFVKAIPRNS